MSLVPWSTLYNLSKLILEFNNLCDNLSVDILDNLERISSSNLERMDPSDIKVLSNFWKALPSQTPVKYMHNGDKTQYLFVLDEINNKIQIIFRSDESWVNVNKHYLRLTEKLYGVHQDVSIFKYPHRQLRRGGMIEKLVANIECYKRQFPAVSIEFSGYGIGGAIATIAAYIVSSYLSTSNFLLVTYGAQPSGTYRFSRYLNLKPNLLSYRLTFDNSSNFFNFGGIHISFAIGLQKWIIRPKPRIITLCTTRYLISDYSEALRNAIDQISSQPENVILLSTKN